MQPNERKTSDRLNVDLLMKTLSEILSEKYGLDITMRAIPKRDGAADGERNSA